MTADLPLQPRNGCRLTLAVGLHRNKRDVFCIGAACFCGRLVSMPHKVWQDGSRRPQSCRPCSKIRGKRSIVVPGRVAPTPRFPEQRYRPWSSE